MKMVFKKREAEKLLKKKQSLNYGTVIDITENKSKKRQKEDTSNIFHLFKYTTAWDKMLLIIGTVFSLILGSCLPILGLFFGGMTNVFLNQATQGLISDEVINATLRNAASEANPEAIRFDQHLVPSPQVNGALVYEVVYVLHEIFAAELPQKDLWEASVYGNNSTPMTQREFENTLNKYLIIYLIIGTVVMICSFMRTLCWEYVSVHQVHTIRQLFFSQIMRQDISWYDTNDNGNLSNKLSDGVERIREGTGYKSAMIIQHLATFISGIGVGLYVNAPLTLVTLCVAPFFIGLTAYTAKFAAVSGAREEVKYGAAGAIAEETLSNIKTVQAFCGFSFSTRKYGEELEAGRKIAMRKYNVFAICVAVMFALMYAAYGLGFWYGSQLVQAGTFTPGSIFTVFFSVVLGAFSIGDVLPYLNTVSTAVGVMAGIKKIISRQVVIDPYSNEGRKLDKIKGDIEFKNVTFSYPSRPDVQILKNLDLKIESGKTVAIVGSSGAGKSTIARLMLRFYDVQQGSICVDNNPINELNVNWWRKQIGLVSQEPVLFGVSIAENIRYGRENVSSWEIVDAAENANAHQFIMKLPKGYDTLVGDTGSQLSGGQKQRITIARALVRNPKILLLDEATSALDAQSEGVVQEALEKAMRGRSMVIVAHRLSTIRNADIIYVMQEGAVFESGKHEDLMKKQSLYYKLVMAQMKSDDKDIESTPNIDETQDESSLAQEEFYELNEQKDYLSSKGKNVENLNLLEEETKLIPFTQPEEIEKDISFWGVLKLYQLDWKWLLLGVTGYGFGGLIVPIFSLFYGQIFTVFTKSGKELIEDTKFWTMMFIILSLYIIVINYCKVIGTTMANEKTTARLRLLVFENILRQPIGWFDLEASSPGILVNRLARNPPLIKAAAGLRMAHVIQSSVILIGAFLIGFICGWKLSLILTVYVLLIIFTSYKQHVLLKRHQVRDSKLIDEAGGFTLEVVRNIRTVQALGQEKLFSSLYSEKLKLLYSEAKKQALFYAVLYGLTQAISYYVYALAFRVGGYFVETGEMETNNIYKVFFALSLCATAVGNAFLYIQDYTKARTSIRLLNHLLTRESEIDCTSLLGIKPDIKGCIQFKKVDFSYPNRASVKVLRGLNLNVEAGKTLALVGESGCGKSTIISLLERFYDPTEGSIEIDGYDIRALNLMYLRSKIGLVTQEPILFNISIKDNIEYGAVSLDEKVSFEQVVKAAKLANLHDFVMNLPEQYDTLVGERGIQLSGGQKQRVAIARALIRDPKILLLDEATSALDTENERIVQEALDIAKKGRTCIIVAHRLSTIQNADKIYVMKKGEIIEEGTHMELLSMKGHYYQLTQRQVL